MERKTRIILFDDDQIIRQTLKQVFERKGYEIFVFENPSLIPLQHSHNCQCAENERCADIVITDIDMPHVSGLDFIDKQQKKGCKIQNIAIMSGSFSEPKIEHAKKLGCSVFSKPFSLIDLIEWIKNSEAQIDYDSNLSSWFLKEQEYNSKSVE